MEREFECRVEEVHSGDDLVAMVDLGVDGLYKRVRLRLSGVDTPSAFKAGPDEVGSMVREDVRSRVVGAKARLLVHSTGRGGWVVTLFVKKNEQELNVNEYLIGKGYRFAQTQG